MMKSQNLSADDRRYHQYSTRCFSVLILPSGHADMPAAEREGHVTNPAGKEFVKVMGHYFIDLQKAVAAGAQVKVGTATSVLPYLGGKSRYKAQSRCCKYLRHSHIYYSRCSLSTYYVAISTCLKTPIIIIAPRASFGNARLLIPGQVQRFSSQRN